MLRIQVERTAGAENGSGNRVKVAGRLAGPWVLELATALRRFDARDPLELDLTEVSFIDADGLAILRSLRDQPAVRLRGSAFINAQID
jgi:ABC-type transporter Mla MlaB component